CSHQFPQRRHKFRIQLPSIVVDHVHICARGPYPAGAACGSPTERSVCVPTPRASKRPLLPSKLTGPGDMDDHRNEYARWEYVERDEWVGGWFDVAILAGGLAALSR